MSKRIEISYKTILFIFAFIGFVWFLNEIKDILIILFISFILMAALQPFVGRLERLKIHRLVAIIIIYLIIISFLTVIGSMLLPPIIKESATFIKNLPFYFEEASKILKLDLSFSASQLTPAGGGVLKFTLGIFSNLVGILSLFFFTFYLLLERNHLRDTLNDFLGAEQTEKIAIIVSKIEKRMGNWVRGQLFLCLVVGLATFIGLTLLNLEYALPLSILAGLLEIVPNIGPITSAIPAVIIALTTSPLLALATAAMYFLIQQAENHLIVPNVMKKITGLSPIIIIVSLMIGGKLMGFLGMILAVPMVLVLQALLQEYLAIKK